MGKNNPPLPWWLIALVSAFCVVEAGIAISYFATVFYEFQRVYADQVQGI